MIRLSSAEILKKILIDSNDYPYAAYVLKNPRYNLLYSKQ